MQQCITNKATELREILEKIFFCRNSLVVFHNINEKMQLDFIRIIQALIALIDEEETKEKGNVS